jgi:hypothetical protein
MTLGAWRLNQIQGEFGESWIHSLCTAAGLVPARPSSDRAGLDLIVHNDAQEFIRLQIKTTASPNLQPDGLHYDLDVQTYDLLRNGSSPGYLIVLVMLAPWVRWTGHTRRGSIVRTFGLWVALDGMPPTQNSSSITVILPDANMVTPEALRGMFP